MESHLTEIEVEISKGENVSVISLVNHLIDCARKANASDIHISPIADGITVRFRIDGILRDVFTLPKKIHEEIITRIKILSRLRTDVHNHAQDGRFKAGIAGAEFDIRVSTIPTFYGENAIMRLLAKQNKNFTLETLGFSKNNQGLILDAIKKLSGMILVTGPTGSGKTTTLYTILELLNSREVSIITLEDPIEYSIKGITQIQTDQYGGLNFANGLRSILRQDPNVIMIGEIRDEETAKLAVNAALTGHLVLSTLHTSDAVGAIPRLFDMSLEPYLVASTISLIVSQRLIRKLCDSCKFERHIESKISSVSDDLKILPGDKIFSSGQCVVCGKSGYSGRVMISEIIKITENLKDLILKKTSHREMRANAGAEGAIFMHDDGVEKVMAGVTSLEEVMRARYE